MTCRFRNQTCVRVLLLLVHLLLVPFLLKQTMGFQIHSNRHPIQHLILHRNQDKEKIKSSSWEISATDGNGDNNDEMRSSLSGGRAGGRKKTKTTVRNATATIPILKNTHILWESVLDLFKKLISALVLLALVKSILSFLFGSPSVVYYQSTVYESSSYNADGKLEKIRKESFKSNIPGFVDGKREGGSSSISDRSLLESRFMRDLDRELDRELDQIEQMTMSEF